MEALRPQDVKLLVEKLVWYLRRECMYVSSCEIRERTAKYEIRLNFEKNIAGISTIKLILSKNGSACRVFTGVTSLDIRLKRFIQRELSKLVGKA